MEPEVGDRKWKDRAEYEWRGKALGWVATGEHEPDWTNIPHAGEPEGSRDRRSEQVGGTHYTSMAIQPYDYCLANGIPYIEGNIIKYVSRWRKKGGVEDLKKARHSLDFLIEHEEKKKDGV